MLAIKNEKNQSKAYSYSEYSVTSATFSSIPQSIYVSIYYSKAARRSLVDIFEQ